MTSEKFFSGLLEDKGEYMTRNDGVVSTGGALAIDIGFSACKVHYDGRLYKFPTSIAAGRESGIDWDTPDASYQFQGRSFKVGDDAVRADGKIYERDISFLLEYAPLLVGYALDLINPPNLPATLITGLPLLGYRRYKNDLSRRLSHFDLNGCNFNFDVVVTAQGAGALFDYVNSDAQGGREEGFIFDVGFNTVIVVGYQKMVLQPQLCDQWEQWGISRPLEVIQSKLKRQHGYDLDLVGVNESILSGHIQGDVKRKVDLPAIVAPAMQDYLGDLMHKLKDRCNRHIQHIEKVVLCGGGAHHLGSFLDERGEYSGKLHVLREPEFANVRGYALLSR